LMKFRHEYNVVVLPEPVGPVTSRIPSGIEMTRSNVFWSSVRKPSSASPSLRPSLSKIRITMLSPWFVGRQETRKSINLFPTLLWMRPSCGMRCSEITMPAWIFKRATIAACNCFGGDFISVIMPSMR